MQPQVTLKTDIGGEANLKKSLAMLQKKTVYVGVPATTAKQRMQDIIKIAATSGKRKNYLLKKAAENEINNAQLVYIHTNGSFLKNIPARPIIEAAIMQRDNLELITSELKLASLAALEGKPELVTRYLNSTALLAEGLVRRWFTDPRNNWAPDSAATIRRKKSSRPLIDTAEMRKSIVGFATEEQ